MEGTSPGPPLPSGVRRVNRRKVLVAILIASVLVTALALSVLAIDEQARGWNEEAIVIGTFAYSFNGTERSLRSLLAREDPAWANESVWWGGIAVDLAYDAWSRDAFPSVAKLGLTWPNVYCAFDGLRQFLRTIEYAPYPFDSVEWVQGVEGFAAQYGNLWSALRHVRPARSDPLSQLGPDQVESIRDSVKELRVLGERFVGMPGCLPDRPAGT
jgi:hypothetical protein